MIISRSLFITFCSLPAWALAATQDPANQGMHVPVQGAPVMSAVPLPQIQGVVTWETLAKVKQVKAKDRILPQFTSEIAALNDKEVKVQGFMMPLEPGETQKHFLLSVNPPSCPYCMPAGPEGIVEVKTKAPVKFSYTPVILSGKMAVLKDDPMGLYYRLTDAVPAPVK